MSDTSRPAWPIFVISLKDAHERRAKIRKALDDRGLEYEIKDAVDGRGGLPEEYEGILNRAGTPAAFTRDMSDTEYACALSHMSVYELIVERQLPGAIVLEDDAILTPLFDEFLEARAYLQGNLIQLDHWHGFVFRLEKRRRVSRRLELARAAKNASLTTGYTISSEGARYFLEKGRPICLPADWPADPTAIGAMLCLPRAVDHPPIEAGSTIQTDRAALEAKAAHERALNPTPRLENAVRFFKASYWKRWWFKRSIRRIS